MATGELVAIWRVPLSRSILLPTIEWVFKEIMIFACWWSQDPRKWYSNRSLHLIFHSRLVSYSVLASLLYSCSSSISFPAKITTPCPTRCDFFSLSSFCHTELFNHFVLFERISFLVLWPTSKWIYFYFLRLRNCSLIKYFTTTSLQNFFSGTWPILGRFVTMLAQANLSPFKHYFKVFILHTFLIFRKL